MKIPFITFASAFIAMALWGCTTERDRNTDIVTSWLGKTLNISDDLTNIAQRNPIELDNKEFVIVRYIDSLCCTTCELKLDRWKLYSRSLDTIPNLSYEILTVIAPTDNYAIELSVKRSSFKHPVVFDNGHGFCKSNDLKADGKANTFLLNKNKKVLLVGDPVMNPSVARLYEKTMRNQK